MSLSKLVARTSRVKQRKGFTLVELIVVVLIIGILASIAIVGYSSFAGKSRTTAATVNLQTFAKAILAEHSASAKSQLSRDVVLQALSSSNPAVTDGLNAADNAVLLGKDGTPSSDKEYAIGFVNELGGAVNDEGGYHAILTTFADDQIVARAISYGGTDSLTLPSETFDPSVSPEDIFDGIEVPEPDPDPEPELPVLALAYAGTTNVDPLTQTSFLPSVSGVQGTPQFSYDLVDGDLPDGFSFSTSSGEVSLDIEGEVITQVAAASGHSAALTSSGKVYTWGEAGPHGTLGHGNTTNRNVPTLVTGVTDVAQIAVDSGHTVALTNSGDVYTWGYGGYGQLGHGDTNSKNKPTKVNAISDVVQIAAGDGQTAAITSNGNLYTWGSGTFDRLGMGPGFSYKTLPTQVTELSDVTQVALGEGHTAAITSNGNLYTWGLATSGRLGHGSDTAPVYEPTQVTSISSVEQVAANASATAAITSDGNLYTWGNGTNVPTLVTALSNVTQVTLGHGHTAAITSNGNLYTWGSGTYGKLGHGDTASQSAPTLVAQLPNVSQVSAGSNHTAAISSSGELHTWGWRGSGHLLGLGNITGNRETPQPVSLQLDPPSWDFTLDVTVADSADRTTTTTSRFNTLP